MADQAYLSAATPIDILARSIRRERERSGLSLSELAKQAGVAKSTLSQLEAGIGNPSLETIWALAMALDIQVSRLIEAPRQHVTVIRAHEGSAAYSEHANYAAVLLAACPSGAQRDLYKLKVQPGEPKISKSHQPGTIEHVILCSGRAHVGPVGQAVELNAGDYISYSADIPHIFDALEKDTLAIMLIEQD